MPADLIPIAEAGACMWTASRDDMRLHLRVVRGYLAPDEQDALKTRGGFYLRLDPTGTGDAGILRQYHRYGWADPEARDAEIAKLDCPMGEAARQRTAKAA